MKKRFLRNETEGEKKEGRWGKGRSVGWSPVSRGVGQPGGARKGRALSSLPAASWIYPLSQNCSINAVSPPRRNPATNAKGAPEIREAAAPNSNISDEETLLPPNSLALELSPLSSDLRG